MGKCGNIAEGNKPDCDNLPVAGTEVEVVVYNLDEYGDTVNENGVITEITPEEGALGYVFKGFRNDIKKTEEVVRPSVGVPMFKHGSGFIVYAKDQATKNTVEKLARGKFVFCVENKGKENDAFEVLGRKVGLQMTAGSILDAHNNGGYYVLPFATADADGELEPKLPQTVFDTDYATTKAMIQATVDTSL